MGEEVKKRCRLTLGEAYFLTRRERSAYFSQDIPVVFSF